MTAGPVADIDLVALSLGCIAVAAGAVIAEIYARGPSTAQKPDASPVTDADLAAERLIVDQLASAFPGVSVVAEELAATGRAPVIADRFILVDPLDGTREFIAGRNEFTVNLALVDGGRPVAGAIYAPPLRRLWFAGCASFTMRVAPGAQLLRIVDAERIGVRTPPVSGLVALVSRSHCDLETDAYLATLPIAERRPVGSSLKFCLIAEGAADLYPRTGPTREWDTAAGQAILMAAGGDVTALDGKPLRYGKAIEGFGQPGFVAVGGFRVCDGVLRVTV